MNPLWLSLATVLATVAGGLCALRLRARLHLLLGFTAGVLFGVVAFDLWPESLEQSRRSSGDGRIAMVALVAGFLLYIGASDILPHAYSRAGPTAALNLAGLTGLGVLTMYGVLRWVG